MDRKLLELRVVPLGDQVEERLTLLVEGEGLIGHLPADRSPVLHRRERVPEPGAVGAVAPERADLLAPIRMM